MADRLPPILIRPPTPGVNPAAPVAEACLKQQIFSISGAVSGHVGIKSPRMCAPSNMPYSIRRIIISFDVVEGIGPL